MKKVFISTVFIATLFISTGLLFGQSEKETRNVDNFKRISFGVSGDLRIHIGPEFRLVIEGDEDDIERTVTEVKGEKLIIKRENWNFPGFNDKVFIDVTMPSLEGLGVSGSGDAEIVDIFKAEDIDLDVSGSGKIITSGIVADNLNSGISGSGNVTLGTGGNIRNAEVSISGSGNFHGENSTIGALDVRISGSGNCRCNVSGTIDASVSGSGNVNYTGNPKINARVSGSGHVKSY